MNHELKKPIVFKNMIPGMHLQKFYSIQKNSLFITLERDLADIAVSMLKARVDRYGNPQTWWSFRTQDYANLQKERAQDQIVAQLSELTHRCNEQISFIPEDQKINLNYQDFCRDPFSLMSQVKDWFDQKGCPVKIKNTIEPFKISKHTDSVDYRNFKKELEGIIHEDHS